MKKIIPVIMAGGTGSRLWPLSRELYPKQFISLNNQYSMLQNTVLRLGGLSVEKPIVICNEAHRFLAAEQLLNIDALDRNIILEPVGKNTAPAIALAALFAVTEYGNDSILLVLAADHVIENNNAFLDAIELAVSHAENDELVTFGIVPSHPETGYGYVHRGHQLSDSDAVYKVDKFVEKPDFSTACEYLKSGEFYWNSGMFMFKSGEYLKELEKYRPDIFEHCSAAFSNIQFDLNFIRVDKDSFELCSSESIDYAVIEKTNKAVVIPMDAGWSDVGSWSSLWDISKKNENNNVIKGDVFLVDSANNYISSESLFIATVGVDNLVVVQTKDSILIADKNSVQDVKQVVSYLKDNNRKEHIYHHDKYKPWGKIQSIDHGEGYQVNRITVKPGGKISSQRHEYRAEHWIVVSGTAKVVKGNTTYILSENESTYIPIGELHTLINIGEYALEVIEIQSGTYFGDDDIIHI
ncbi:mannose-1-phosphate guanylyltransferase/mannose-6-phosphate isomerase [Kosakonia oryzae]|uniref:mannose-1-phosphate guanylyltransferase n=1 Tax=Kosakonia oryzae TaxID=497725 RepID=A0AA94KQ96_9ENTR|nr:mannose-1-phosphate guanylyltransferase/mannose-6-phosphate isomerase [Kosakonia oryzae]ANI82290.1 mannose-1-phosphate guanylyltransferase/mannose-6-phosphate isomerase [Kosakonia oryzae]SFC53466.1 mannose-1-phosphate guanylyltransferase [Kosakonia oryzae]